MRKLTRNVLKELIREVLKEASSSRSTSTMRKGGKSGETNKAQADYDRHVATGEPSATITKTNTDIWINPHKRGDKGTKLGPGEKQPKFAWAYNDGVRDRYGSGTTRDYNLQKKSLDPKNKWKWTDPKKTENPTTTEPNPANREWNKKKTDLSGRLTKSKTADTKKRTQAVASMKATRGGRKAGSRDKGRGGTVSRASASKFAKLSGYEPVKGKGKKGKEKGKDDEE